MKENEYCNFNYGDDRRMRELLSGESALKELDNIEKKWSDIRDKYSKISRSAEEKIKEKEKEKVSKEKELHELENKISEQERRAENNRYIYERRNVKIRPEDPDKFITVSVLNPNYGAWKKAIEEMKNKKGELDKSITYIDETIKEQSEIYDKVEKVLESINIDEIRMLKKELEIYLQEIEDRLLDPAIKRLKNLSEVRVRSVSSKQKVKYLP